jgi:hypothetical protein
MSAWAHADGMSFFSYGFMSDVMVCAILSE